MELVNSAQMHYSLENSQKLWLLFMNSALTIALTAQVSLKRSLKKKKSVKHKGKTKT